MNDFPFESIEFKSAPPDNSIIIPSEVRRPQPTDHQHSIIEQIMGDIFAAQHTCLCGGAGTGKSFVTGYLVDMLRDSGLSVEVAATTHKAVNVIAENLPEGVHCGTIHSALGLRPVVNDEGKEIMKQGRKGDTLPDDLDVLIVDEISMAGTDLYKCMIRATTQRRVRTAEEKRVFGDDAWVKRKRIVLLLVGDKWQLPPVGETMSPFFEDSVIRFHELTEVHRQAAGSPIITLATGLREHMMVGAPLPRLENSKKIKLFDDSVKWNNKVKKGMSKRSDTSRFIAFTNKKVLQAGYALRAHIDGFEDTMPRVGEVFVANQPVTDGEEVLIPNNADCQFMDVRDSNIGGMTGWMCDVMSGNRDNVHEVFHPANQALVKQELKKLAEKAAKTSEEEGRDAAKPLWREYFKMKQSVSDLRPSYAMTAHKSQGSGYDHIFLDLRDMATIARFDKSMYYRAVYTAVTRAKNKLHIMGSMVQ